jgi:hypothetical protein
MVLFPSTIRPKQVFGIAVFIFYLVFRVIRRIIRGRKANMDNNEREAFWLNLAGAIVLVVFLGGFFVLIYINNR